MIEFSLLAPTTAEVVVQDFAGFELADGGIGPIPQSHSEPLDLAAEESMFASYRLGKLPTSAGIFAAMSCDSVTRISWPVVSETSHRPAPSLTNPIDPRDFRGCVNVSHNVAAHTSPPNTGDTSAPRTRSNRRSPPFVCVTHRRTKGIGTRRATLTMLIKLAESASQHWRTFNAAELLIEVTKDTKFQDRQILTPVAA